jgi:hypothetical protein
MIYERADPQRAKRRGVAGRERPNEHDAGADEVRPLASFSFRRLVSPRGIVQAERQTGAGACRRRWHSLEAGAAGRGETQAYWRFKVQRLYGLDPVISLPLTVKSGRPPR